MRDATQDPSESRAGEPSTTQPDLPEPRQPTLPAADPQGAGVRSTTGRAVSLLDLAQRMLAAVAVKEEMLADQVVVGRASGLTVG